MRQVCFLHPDPKYPSMGTDRSTEERNRKKMSECRVGSAKRNAGERVCCDRCDRRSGKDRRMDRGLFHCYVQHATWPTTWGRLQIETFKTGT